MSPAACHNSIKSQPHWSTEQLFIRLNNLNALQRDDWLKSPLPSSKQLDEVGCSDRDRSVKLMMKLTMNFQFGAETFFLAVNILDRFLTKVKVHPRYLKCITITCFYLACKFHQEEENIPRTIHLIEASNVQCRIADVLRLERIIVDKLRWNIHTSTSVQYLYVFHAIAVGGNVNSVESQLNLQKLVSMLSHLISCYHIAFTHASKCLALSLLSVNMQQCGFNWRNVILKIAAFAKVSKESIMACRREIQENFIMQQATNENKLFVVSVPIDEKVEDSEETPYNDVLMGDDEESANQNEESDDVIYEQEVYDMDHDFVEDDCDVAIEDEVEVVMSPAVTYAQIVKRSQEEKVSPENSNKLLSSKRPDEETPRFHKNFHENFPQLPVMMHCDEGVIKGRPVFVGA